MIIQAYWKDGSRTNFYYVTSDKVVALKQLAKSLTMLGADELVNLTLASTEEEIENLPEPTR